MSIGGRAESATATSNPFNRAAIAAYDDVFDGAAKIFIFEPASQGAATHAQLSQDEIVARTRAANFDAKGCALLYPLGCPLAQDVSIKPSKLSATATALGRVGIATALVELTRPEFDIPVVRAVAP